MDKAIQKVLVCLMYMALLTVVNSSEPVQTKDGKLQEHTKYDLFTNLLYGGIYQ